MIRYFIYFVFLNIVFVFNCSADELRITSDNLEVDRKNKISIFSGNVYANNADIEIWSEMLIIKYNEDESGIKQLNAKKSVKIINEGITATGTIGEYYPDNDTLNLYGEVVVVENNNYVKCDELYLDLKNSTSIMKSASSKRVEAYIVNN